MKNGDARQYLSLIAIRLNKAFTQPIEPRPRFHILTAGAGTRGRPFYWRVILQAL